MNFCHRPLALVTVAGFIATGDPKLSVPVIAIAMGRSLLCVYLLVLVIFQEACGLKIQNKLLGKCLQVHEGTLGGRVSLGDCSPYSALQEWRWLPESQALSNHHTGDCLTAPGEQYEGVLLQRCVFRAGSDESDAGLAVVDTGRGASSQAWSCSKKGHLTLKGRGLQLSATQESTLVFLSREHKQPGSRWRTFDNQTLCNGRDSKHNQHQPHHHLVGGIMAGDVTETYYPVMDVPLWSLSTKSPADPTMVFFRMDYGMGWKITMLVLSSLALVLGTVILILNVYSNRRKKVVCVLKSYTPRPEVSVPGSPAASERALLTEHAMRLPHSSPTLRGEILIEWKDGTVTPLYEA
ncbi:uncharacterized protein LOC114555926 isoform X2 [Perca flavescens]|uniref:uncharacterized protein LOC114555926 isoform X2 n=1 Tax=Perca flavescens TaxID=8167 RepID=UPI00106DE114|nr:uncharacterized protein LOC114555926 isoform X2 [Perca flavescens]